MKRALISVSNKEGVVDFSRGLADLGYEIISTGGTYQTIKDAGIPVRKVADITGFPEILDGRVKTLHPKIHGGILARRTQEHLAELQANQITPIDIVAVNLYPFRETVARPGVTLEDAVENIDIGGPAMVRAAAKNHQHVVIVVNPARYEDILGELRSSGTVSQDTRFKLACEAFTHTAAYDSMISSYLSGLTGEKFGDIVVIGGEKVYDLRYGENPHQQAAFYRFLTPGSGLPDARQLNGKELSYNNIVDTQAAWDLVCEFDKPACVIIKHTNPCGAAVAANLEEAFVKAFAADSLSAFGGIIALNRKVDANTARKMAEPFMEVIIAPDYEDEALEILRAKKNLRVLSLPLADNKGWRLRTVQGGFIVQDDDTDPKELPLQVVTTAQPKPEQMDDLAFAWKVVKHVKSNAIVVVKDGVSVGVGAGQMNRVGSAKIALEQAGEKGKGAVLASDAFFPFKDTVELAAQYGITAIIQPGGSVRDQESIDECNQKDIAMIFTGIRHFRH